VDFLVDINRQIQGKVGYVIRLEPGVQTPEETLELARGSCRDSAWLLVQVLRHLGLAARFVSGYLIQLVPDVKSLDGPSGTDHDFTDLHAWCEVYLPGAGWIGLDPTSGLFAGEGHIPLACSPQPSSASPITGFTEKCECEFEHRMRIERVWEAPRVTKPYSDEQWQAIEALGHQIDADLIDDDVRLTMGGEPTFVSIDDHDGAEWNTEALGPTKRVRAAEIFHRLREKYAPNGLQHFGQGKWYPGEQLPRWSLNCLWRCDGEPVWNDPALYADETRDLRCRRGPRRALPEAPRRSPGDRPQVRLPAYEDVYYYLWREHRLPANVDPFDARLEDPLERRRLAQVFRQGLDQAIGHVLPVYARRVAGRADRGSCVMAAATSSRVTHRSAIGCRSTRSPGSPATTIPTSMPPTRPRASHPCARTPRSAPSMPSATARVWLPKRPRSAAKALPGRRSTVTRLPARTPATASIARHSTWSRRRWSRARRSRHRPATAFSTSSCRRPRRSRTISNSSPPSKPPPRNARFTGDSRRLRAAARPATDQLPRHSRPGRHRSQHPAVGDLGRTRRPHDASLRSRAPVAPVTEKFMLDGRHTGTGGGNHFVFGGATTLDSPFLRRPDLLRSLISYWHNHPSLVLSLLGPVHRPDESVAARRRGAQRFGL
jgi:hypothetical protein